MLDCIANTINNIGILAIIMGVPTITFDEVAINIDILSSQVFLK